MRWWVTPRVVRGIRGNGHRACQVPRLQEVGRLAGEHDVEDTLGGSRNEPRWIALYRPRWDGMQFHEALLDQPTHLTEGFCISAAWDLETRVAFARSDHPL